MPKQTQKVKQDNRARQWAFIAYPDSAPENWREIIKLECKSGAISPLHDADFNADNTQKKPHWHILIKFEGKKSYSQIKEIADKIHATIPQKVNSLTAYSRYLCHLDNPEKTQYDVEYVETWGDFDFQKEIMSNSDYNAMIQCKIIDLIEANDIREYYHLILMTKETFGNNSEEFKYTTNHTIFFNAFVKSRKFAKLESLQRK